MAIKEREKKEAKSEETTSNLVASLISALRPDLSRKSMPVLYDEYAGKVSHILNTHILQGGEG